MKTTVAITSFGYRHGGPPMADLTFDLRRPFRDPHVSDDLRNLTAEDWQVQTAVLSTPGIVDLIEAAAAAVRAVAGGIDVHDVTVASGCAGGRHRAPVFADMLAEWLRHDGYEVTVAHRDLRKPVIAR